jgi:glucose uptake protein GlcU
MIIAAILFAIAALGGVVMALMRFSGRDYPPVALAVIHGLFAAAGLIALILIAFAPGVVSSVRLALLLFLVAAIGGFTLIYYHAKKRPLPISVVVIHGLIAVVAFVILIVGIMGHA